MSLAVHCSKCNRQLILASGYNAATMSRQRQYEAMMSMGWQAMPVKLCRDCACPMKFAERHKAIQISYCGSDEQLAAFRDQMKACYPADKVDRWFNTLGVKI